MVIELKMPVLGLTMEKAIILEWVKAEGDRLEVDDTVLVVETDKAATDVPSPVAGILGRIVAQPEEEVPVGHVIAYIAENEADLASLPAAPPPPAPTVSAQAPASAASTATPGLTSPASATAPAAAPTGDGRRPEPGERLFASPRARKTAAEHGVDLGLVNFAGERITEADVLRALADGTARAGAPAPVEGLRITPLATRLAAELGLSLADLEAEPGVRIRATDLLAAAARAEQAVAPVGPDVGGPRPAVDFATGELRVLNRVRRITAERMAVNWQAPQVTYTTRADMTKAMALRSELQEIAESRGTRLSYDAMFVRAAATALLEFPQVNAQWAEGQGIVLSAEAHVGVAVDLGDGLIVPVVRSAQGRHLLDIAAEVERLVATAREGGLGPDDYKGGTFTISNLGLFGIEAFTPIVNLPEAAILGIGAIVPTPVLVDGELRESHLCTLSLTADHRIVDGAPAARFLARIKGLMEKPILLLEQGI
jgi:pyruvate dehydrogenase E2 component (dihydrolipoamide acetyltransferase)